MKKKLNLDEFSNVKDLHPNGVHEAVFIHPDNGVPSLLNKSKTDPRNGETLAPADAEDLEMVGVEWLWPGRFARGKFGLIAALPDMGKGQIAAFIAAAVTA